MKLPAGLFAVAAIAISAAWWWLGAAVEMSHPPSAGGAKLYCVSYAPFRGSQTPLGPDSPIDPEQIEQDLSQLAKVTNCIRTYSVDHGLDRVAEIAERHGIKVLQGLWVSGVAERTRQEVATVVALAQRYPQVIQAVIVGNEVLLRGEMSPAELVRTIREVKKQVAMPVTYADVWEFWLRYPEVAAAVDFITIHILPYWEDVPLPVEAAPRHVQAIGERVAAAFPGKEIFVGEFGWPSAGRMREGALPSPINQARAVQGVVARSNSENFKVNVIEAYDQPWKRQLEGTVGGHWGLFDAYRRQPKFVWGEPVSNHPFWKWQAAGGTVLAALVFGAGFAGASRRPDSARPVAWLAIAVIAAVSGTLIGWTIELVPLESLTAGDWIRSSAWTAASLFAPLLAAAALGSEIDPASFAHVLGRRAERVKDSLALASGAALILITVLAVQAALGLVFDPRYRDFPFAPLAGAVVPFVAMIRPQPRLKMVRPGAESVAAATLALSAVLILFNETLANWQALWFCGGLAALAFVLIAVPNPSEARAARG
jgi:glucan 1,3-beta-glucosidase